MRQIIVSGPYSTSRSRIERNLCLTIAIILLAVAIGVPVLLYKVWWWSHEATVLDMNAYVYQILEREGR